jgi:drug/metabolite transporter (DMT)-like permease
MEKTMQSGVLVDHTNKVSRSGIWFVMFAAGLWGLGPVFRVMALDYITSTQIVFIEHLLLLLYAVPVLWIHRSELKNCSWRDVGALLFISWGGSVIATIMFTEAFAIGNVNGVLLLQKLQPVFAIILARFILKELLPKGFVGFLLLAIAGTYLLTFGWSLPIGHINEVLGASSLLALGAAFLWGGSTVMGRLLLNKMSYETVTSLRFLLALPLLSALIITQAPSWDIPSSAWGTISINIMAQAFIPGLLSIILYYRGLSTTKASYATFAELSFPMVGVVVNWIAFDQMITFAQIMGFVLIWIALYFISRQNN